MNKALEGTSQEFVSTVSKYVPDIQSAFKKLPAGFFKQTSTNVDIPSELWPLFKLQGAGCITVVKDTCVLQGIRNKPGEPEAMEYFGGKVQFHDFIQEDNNGKTLEEIVIEFDKFRNSVSEKEFDEVLVDVARIAAPREQNEEAGFVLKDRLLNFVRTLVNGSYIYLFIVNTEETEVIDNAMTNIKKAYEEYGKSETKPTEIPSMKELVLVPRHDYVSDVKTFMEEFNKNPKQNPSKVKVSNLRFNPPIRGFNNPVVSIAIENGKL